MGRGGIRGSGRAGRSLSSGGGDRVGQSSTFRNATTEFRFTRNFGNRYDVGSRPVGSRGRFNPLGSLPIEYSRDFVRRNRLR